MIVSLMLNIILIILEIYVLIKLKKKRDIFKYYTYLQNLLCLIVSIIFCVFVINSMIFDVVIPEYVGGLRYIVSTGLVFTSIVYIMFLSSNKSNQIKDKEFVGISGKTVNLLLHYICPIVSLISFIFFEKSIELSNGIWTMLVALPSCLYWVIYLILSVFRLWDEPYNFTNKKNSIFFNILVMVSIPILFILVSFIIWNVR